MNFLLFYAAPEMRRRPHPSCVRARFFSDIFIRILQGNRSLHPRHGGRIAILGITLPVACVTFLRGKKWLNLTYRRRGRVRSFKSDLVYNGTEIMLAARSEARNSPFTLHETVPQYFPSSFCVTCISSRSLFHILMILSDV